MASRDLTVRIDADASGATKGFNTAAQATRAYERELKKMEGKLKERGYTIVPLRLFFNEKNLVKMEVGLAKGKKLHDKRESIKQRETDREIKRYLK